MKTPDQPPQGSTDDLERFDRRPFRWRMQWAMVFVGVSFLLIAVLTAKLYVEKNRADAALMEAQRQREIAVKQREMAVRAQKMAREAEKAAIEAKKRAEESKASGGAKQ